MYCSSVFWLNLLQGVQKAHADQQTYKLTYKQFYLEDFLVVSDQQ